MEEYSENYSHDQISHYKLYEAEHDSLGTVEEVFDCLD